MRHIDTERLSLRPLLIADATSLHDLWTSAGVRKYLWDDEIISLEQTEEIVLKSKELFEKEGTGLWAVMIHGADELIGFSGYWYFQDPPELELLYGIRENCWGRGYASEAAAAILKYGFAELSFSQVLASTDAANIASIRVMEKLGMKYRQRVSKDKTDLVYYVLPRQTYDPGSSIGKSDLA